MVFNTRPDLNVNEASVLVYNVDRQLLESKLIGHESDEIILITQGTGIFQIGSSEGVFVPGTIAYVKAGTLRCWSSGHEAGIPVPVSALVVHVPRKALCAEFLELREAAGVQTFLEKIGRGAFVHLQAYQRIETRLKTILGAKGMLRIARTHALLELLSNVNNWQVLEDEKLGKGSMEDRARLKRVYHFLETHFASGVKRESLAQLVGMEPNSFSRFFHRASGQKLTDYLAVIRVRHAATLLGTRRRMPVSEVARESGFQNVSAFNRQFKKRLGVTPRSYRSALNSEPVLP